MCARTLAGSSKALAPAKHQLMARAETGGGSCSQVGLAGRRGQLHWRGAGLEPSREQPGKEGGLSGALTE